MLRALEQLDAFGLALVDALVLAPETATLDEVRDLVGPAASGQQVATGVAGLRELALVWGPDPALHLVILDELNIVLRYDTLPLDEVLAALAARRPGLHVVVTGRNAKPELIEAADLVTEMTQIKHPFRSGIKAQAGVEY